jgi:hypothetical protein
MMPRILNLLAAIAVIALILAVYGVVTALDQRDDVSALEQKIEALNDKVERLQQTVSEGDAPSAPDIPSGADAAAAVESEGVRP